eukprot:3716985-Rhodomonas_salina.1
MAHLPMAVTARWERGLLSRVPCRRSSLTDLEMAWRDEGAVIVAVPSRDRARRQLALPPRMWLGRVWVLPGG